MFEGAIASRAEIKLADLKTAHNVSNVNQWLAGLGFQMGSIESWGSKKAGARLLFSKVKHLFAD